MTEVPDMQTQHVSFRASSKLTEALAEKAASAGCSVSEYLRSIAREKVGLQ
jgi:predicted HicB family RNase H-like nuclease